MCHYYTVISLCVLLTCAVMPSVHVSIVSSASTNIATTMDDIHESSSSIRTTTVSVTRNSSTTDNASTSLAVSKLTTEMKSDVRRTTPANTNETTENTTSSHTMATAKNNTNNAVAPTGTDLRSGGIAAGVVLVGAFICIGFVYFASNIRMGKRLDKEKNVKKSESVKMRETTNL